MNRNKITVTVFALLCIVFNFLPGELSARSLYWQDMQVHAYLDASGTLQVREKQTMVFTGDWNGGERVFNIRPGQQFRFQGVSRIDADGREVQLNKGKLNLVDHWDYHGAHTIRWRARLPSDPVFSGRVISYVLSYSLGRILLSSENGYTLNHDFCFPDRSGVVKNFHLRLGFDPAWQASELVLQRSDIAPGRGVVVRKQLNFAGDVAPLAYKPPLGKRPPMPAPSWLGIVLAAVLAAFSLWRFLALYGWEKKRERFTPLPPIELIDQQWLEREIFQHKPEVVGAMWDKSTAGPEVAAVLARLVQEEKLQSWMEPFVLPFFNIQLPFMTPVMHLRRLEPKRSFFGYERKLIDGLFVEGAKETDTVSLRRYYRKKRKTFDPVAKIRKPLQQEVDTLTRDKKNPLEMIWLPTLIVGGIAFMLLLTNAFIHQTELPLPMLPAIMVAGVCWFVGISIAVSYRNGAAAKKSSLFGIVFLLLVLLTGFVALLSQPTSYLLLFGVFLLVFAASNNMTNLARSRDTVEGIAKRRRMAAAREFFKKELRKEKPAIQDAWFPYLLAFGLGPTVDSWYARFGRSYTYTGSSSVGGAGGGSGGFTGGGGAFGGGGASGSWSAAVGSLAASGASSSSGGGGSGGGGSSGGGGGGGF